MLTVLYGSFFQIIKAKDSAENAMELYHEASVIFSRMTKDLQGAYLRGKVYSESGKTTYPSLSAEKRTTEATYILSPSPERRGSIQRARIKLRSVTI